MIATVMRAILLSTAKAKEKTILGSLYIKIHAALVTATLIRPLIRSQNAARPKARARRSKSSDRQLQSHQNPQRANGSSITMKRQGRTIGSAKFPVKRAGQIPMHDSSGTYLGISERSPAYYFELVVFFILLIFHKCVEIECLKFLFLL